MSATGGGNVDAGRAPTNGDGNVDSERSHGVASEKAVVDGDQKCCCLICNEELPASAFVKLSCSHRFCGKCAGIIEQGGVCPRCLDEFATRVVDGGLGYSPSKSIFLGNSPSSQDAAISADTDFSIWDPFAPKTPTDQNQQPFSCATRSPHCAPELSSVEDATDVLASAIGLLGIGSSSGVSNSNVGWSQESGTQFPSHNSHGFPKCTMCDQESCFATVRCVQCRETLCNECVLAHYRMRVTREHELIRLVPSRITTSQQSSQDFHVSSVRERSAGRVEVAEVCAVHELPYACDCVTCQRIGLCALCICAHSKHQLTPHGDVHSALVSLLALSKVDVRNLEEVFDAVRRMSERIDASLQAVVRDLRSVIHKHISALEERKRDLLQRVDTIRQCKMDALKAQSEEIAQKITILTDSIKAVEGHSLEEISDAQIWAIFESMLRIYREPKLHLMPFETDQIKFIPPESNFVDRLRKLGELDCGVNARATYIVGDKFKRTIRNRVCNTQVQARDACGDICSAPLGEVSATLTSPDGQLLQVHVSEGESGMLTLNYCPRKEGNHILDVTIRGVSVSGCPAVIQVRKGRDYSQISGSGPRFSFGGEGSENGKLCRPWGICCDQKGRIIVADRSNNRIQIFDKDGNYLLKFGCSGTRPGQFDRPAGVAVNSVNEIIVADKDNHRVQVFNENGTFMLTFGDRGRGAGLFNYPWGVAVNSINQIAVSDTRNHRIQIFSQSGLFMWRVGSDSLLFYKNLDSPRGVCYLDDGQLIMTDFNNHRLAKVQPQNSSDLKCYGSEGKSNGCFCRPQGVAVDGEGHILVCDSRNNRIQVLNADDMQCVATFGGSVGSPPSNGQHPSSSSVPCGLHDIPSTMGSSVGGNFPLDCCELDRPTDVCVSRDGLIYVVDFGNNCIRVF